MIYKTILDKLELPEYEISKIYKKIPKNIQYGNPARFAKKLLYLKKPILNWKKFIKYIPKPQDYRSDAVKKEILFLKNLQNNLTKTEIKRVYKHDRSTRINFYDFIKMHGYSPSYSLYYRMNKELGHIILKLKMYYQRPRAFQISHYHNIELMPLDSNSAWSPAYPSGHGFQAYFWYKFYSYKYPKLKHVLKKFGKEMADSRLYGGYHYPSDNIVSKKLVDVFFEKNLHIYLEKKVKKKFFL